MRHPASGYVQGINDLLTPFYFVFLGEHIGTIRSTVHMGLFFHPMLYSMCYVSGTAKDAMDCDVSTLPQEARAAIEADAYWCMTRLLDGIQVTFKMGTSS